MRKLAAIIWLSAGFAGGMALGAEDLPAAAETAALVASPELEAIFADWAARKAQMPSGDFEWRVVQQIRSPTFGALSVAEDVPVAMSKPRLLRTQFDASSFRLEGGSLPAVLLSQSASFSSIPTSATAEGQFRAAMAARFALPGPVEKPQPYTVLINSHREIHFWAQKGEAHASGVVLAAGQRNRSLDEHAAAALHAKLLDAMQFAVHPSFGIRQADWEENCRMLDEHAVVEGRPCLVIEESHGSGRFWIDPSRGSVVVRRLLVGTDNSVQWQYDIDYDRNADGVWMPVKLNVLRMNTFGDAYDQISIIRESGSLNVETPQALTWDVPPGTLVTDRVAHEQYFVRADGTRRAITYREAIAGITYAELQSGRAARAVSSPKQRPVRSSVGRAVIKLLTWPWILFTLSMIYAVSMASRKRIRRPERRGMSMLAGMGQDQT